MTLADKTEKRIVGFTNGLIRIQCHFSGVLLTPSSCASFIHRLASFMVPKVVVAIPGLMSPTRKIDPWYELSFPYQPLSWRQ